MQRPHKQWLKCKIVGGGTVRSGSGPGPWSCAFEQSEVGNALSHKLEVEVRRSLASHYSLNTDHKL